MNRRVKILGACALTLAVTLSGLALPRAYAAKAVDVNKECSIEFNLQNSVYDAATENKDAEKAEDFAELNKLHVQVHLYRVADIKETGAYTETKGFEELKLDQISDKTTAEQWAEKAAKARELIESRVEPAAGTAVTLENGKGKVSGLATGMYLIVADEVKTPYFTYSFKESLISLPNNYWYNSQSDDWIYNLTEKNAVGLKPDREERTGDLVINKTLTSYNATVGGATFVFHVNVEKRDGTVTNNVYKMEFTGAGNDSLTISDLPAGAKVTVTEEYSGASYKLVSDKDQKQKTTIIAQEEEGNPVSVSFVNKYNGGQNGGTGIVNRFYMKDGSVDCENDLKPEVN